MDRLDDIVFKNRNRSYGAYNLRKRSPVIQLVAIAIAATLFISVFVAFFIYYNLPDDLNTADHYDYDNSSITNPYQPDMDLFEAQQPAGEEEKKINDPKVVREIVAEDTAKKENKGNGTDSTALANGAGNENKPGDTLHVTDLNYDKYNLNTFKMITHVDKPPMFPGGENARRIFLQKNMVYPEFAKKNKIEGPVYVTFIVEPDSSVTNIKILMGIGAGCDDEAMRVARAMPKWAPGIKDGETIRFQVTMPLIFTMYTE